MPSRGPELRHALDLIVTDLDGTLLDEESVVETPAALWDALARFVASGGQWWVATGRARDDALDALARHGARTHPTGVIETEQLIHDTRDPSPREDLFWNEGCRAAQRALFGRHRDAVAAIIACVDRRFPGTRYEDALSPLCFEARGEAELAEILALLAPWVRGMTGAAVARNGCYARVTHRAFHKGSALRRVQRRMGLAPARTLAMGNDLNDLAMLDPRVAAHLLAPGDAVAAVRARVYATGGVVGLEEGPRGTWRALCAWGARGLGAGCATRGTERSERPPG